MDTKQLPEIPVATGLNSGSKKGSDRPFTSLQTDQAPAALGPYVQALASDQLVFLSGQLGLDPATGELAETVSDQANQALANVDAILKSAGLRRENIIKTTLFLTAIDDFEAVNKVYADFFGDHRPARSCVAVAALPKSARFEVECIAIRMAV